MRDQRLAGRMPMYHYLDEEVEVGFPHLMAELVAPGTYIEVEAMVERTLAVIQAENDLNLGLGATLAPRRVPNTLRVALSTAQWCGLLNVIDHPDPEFYDADEPVVALTDLGRIVLRPHLDAAGCALECGGDYVNKAMISLLGGPLTGHAMMFFSSAPNPDLDLDDLAETAALDGSPPPITPRVTAEELASAGAGAFPADVDSMVIDMLALSLYELADEPSLFREALVASSLASAATPPGADDKKAIRAFIDSMWRSPLGRPYISTAAATATTGTFSPNR